MDLNQSSAVILRCPSCGLALVQADRSYVCVNNHSFDIARKGYVNLLLAHQKNSKDPGDNKEMIQRRNSFLNQGFYAPISDAINQMVVTHGLTAATDAPAIADMGCGEGYYIDRLSHVLKAPEHHASIFGLDISKHGIQSAASRNKDILFLVASINSLPFLDDSLDLLINVFSPENMAEFSRVLKPTGTALVVSPGPKHLYALKKYLYDDPRYHAEQKWVETFSSHFSLIAHEQVHYPIALDTQQTIADLLIMTPYYWNIPQAKKDAIQTLLQLDVDVDIEVSLFKKH